MTTLLTWGIPETDTMAKGRAAHRPASPDTAAVTLDEGILELTELLAAHSHAAWARRRLDDGWRHGPRRDDARKEHPGLVPYDELPESEKQYDRATALETLKAMRALGYRIQPPAGDTAAENDGALGLVPQAEETADLLAGRSLPALLDLGAILSVWRARAPGRIARSPDLVRRLGERAIELGEPLFACDMLAEGLEHWPQAPFQISTNHHSGWDPLLMLAVSPLRPRVTWFGPKEVDFSRGFKNRVMGFFGGMIPFNPRKTNLGSSVKAVQRVFDSGGVLAIASEGTLGFRESELLPRVVRDVPDTHDRAEGLDESATAFRGKLGVPCHLAETARRLVVQPEI